jgi:hypothetical protein
LKDPASKALVMIGYDHTTREDKNGEDPMQKAILIYRREGLDNGEKPAVKVDPEIKQEVKQEVEDKQENTNLFSQAQLTSNFDELTGKKQEEVKQEDKPSPSVNSPTVKIDKKVLITLKADLIKICGTAAGFRDHFVTVDQDVDSNKVRIKLSDSLNNDSLNHLIDGLGDKATRSSEPGKKGHQFTILMIDRENLSKILQDNIPQMEMREIKVIGHEALVSDEPVARSNGGK